MSWYTSKKLWSAIGGAAATIIVQQLAKTPCIRKAAVTVASKAIITKENADAALQSFSYVSQSRGYAPAGADRLLSIIYPIFSHNSSRNRRKFENARGSIQLM